MSRTSLAALRDGFLAVREAMITATLRLPAEACFRTDDRIVMDMVWEPIQAPPRAQLLFHQLLAVPGSDLGPHETWEMRREAMLRRYYHAVEAMIDLTLAVDEAGADRPGTRGGKPDTFRAALERSLSHDYRYLDRLVTEYVPRVLLYPALEPIAAPLPRDPVARAAARRDTAAAALEGVAATVGQWLQRLTVQQVFEADFASPICDFYLHTSNKHTLGEVNRRMLHEDNPELGNLASPAGFWAREQEALQQQVAGLVAAWRAVPEERLGDTGMLGGEPYSVVMAIEDTLDGYLDFADGLQAKLDREGWALATP